MKTGIFFAGVTLASTMVGIGEGNMLESAQRALRATGNLHFDNENDLVLLEHGPGKSTDLQGHDDDEVMARVELAERRGSDFLMRIREFAMDGVNVTEEGFSAEDFEDDEGDDDHHDDDDGTHRQLGSWRARLWKNRDRYGRIIIPYKFKNLHFTHSERKGVEEVLSATSNYVKVLVFKEWERDDVDYVSFRSSGEGCYSYFGYRGGRQVVNLERPHCLEPVAIIRALFHTVGVNKESNRRDRDNYVDIKWDGIVAGKELEFRKDKRMTGYGYPYDYNSVMHPSEYAFGKPVSKCVDTEHICNDRLVTISYVEGNGSPRYCLDIENGYRGIRHGSKLRLARCGDDNFKNQLFLIDRYDESSVIFKYVFNEDFCLTVDHNYLKDPRKTTNLEMHKCLSKEKRKKGVIISKYENQRFEVHGNDVSHAKLRWESNNDYCVTRDTGNTPSSSPSFYKQPVICRKCSSDDDQYWRLDFYRMKGVQYDCAKLPVWCQRTMDHQKTCKKRANVPTGSHTISLLDKKKIQAMYRYEEPN